MSHKKHRQQSQNTTLVSARAETKRPFLFTVYLVNDDYTPMDFVVEVLMEFFGLTQERATQLMWQIHNGGRGNCGQYVRDIAETKVLQVNNYSRINLHPLLCRMEEN